MNSKTTSTRCSHDLKTMRFEVAGEVIGKGRPRFTRSGRTYTPKKTQDYEKVIKTAYLSKYSYLSKKSLRIKIIAYLEVAKSHSKVKKTKMLANQLQCTKKPDIDNITKVVLDALNKVAYLDDTQVVELAIIKRWSDAAKLKIIIEEIGETMNSKEEKKNELMGTVR